MTFNVDDFLSQREGNEDSCQIVMKGRLADEISRLQDEFKMARRLDESENRVPQAPGIADQIEALRAEMEASARTFEFEELPRHEYEDLIGEHPPRKVDSEGGAQWNADTFPPALIAAASKEPKLTPKDAQRLWDDLPFGEARRLWLTALSPQGKVGSVPLAVSGTGSTTTIGTKSGTADQEESPEASS